VLGTLSRLAFIWLIIDRCNEILVIQAFRRYGVVRYRLTMSMKLVRHQKFYADTTIGDP